MVAGVFFWAVHSIAFVFSGFKNSNLLLQKYTGTPETTRFFSSEAGKIPENS
jgi:hypothetical protein